MTKTLPHLPDLPDAGYSSPKQKAATDTIMLFMRAVERNRFQLLTIVIEGREKWRSVAAKVWRGLPIDTEALDEIFFYFTLQAAQSHPSTQRALLDARKNPAKVRDIVRTLLPKLETEREAVRLIDKWSPRAE